METNLSPREWKKKAKIKVKRRLLYSIHNSFIPREPIGLVTHIHFRDRELTRLYENKPIYYIGTCVDKDGLVRHLGYFKPYSQNTLINYSKFIYLGYIEVNNTGKIITESDLLNIKPLYNDLTYLI